MVFSLLHISSQYLIKFSYNDNVEMFLIDLIEAHR